MNRAGLLPVIALLGCGVSAATPEADGGPGRAPAANAATGNAAADAGDAVRSGAAGPSASPLPPPSIQNVSPSFGNRLGGAELFVTGAGFRPGVTVTIGDAPCAAPVLVSESQVKCRAPRSSAGKRAVTVINADAQKATLPNAFEVRGFVGVLSYAGASVSTFRVDAAGGALSASAAQFSPSADFGAPALGGKYFYVPNYDQGTVSGYAVDPASGAMTPVAGSPFAAGTHPQAIAAEPSSPFVFVTNYEAAGTVRTFRIDPASGALSASASGVVAAGSNPVLDVVDSLGRFLFVANYAGASVSSYGIDPSSGALAPTAGSPFSTGAGPQGLAVDRSGKFLFVGNYEGNTIGVYAIAPTGALSAVAGSPFPSMAPLSIAIAPDGSRLFAASYTQNVVTTYSIDPMTGALSTSSTTSTGQKPQSIAIDPGGAYLYAVTYGAKTLETFAIAPGTGALSSVSVPLSLASAPYSISAW